ncbi:MAG: hypothetical protein ACR2M1_04690, partial [Gemmatimonadaceae bacterium]
MPPHVREVIEVVDAIARVWRCYERQNTGTGIAAGPRCLLAETEGIIRRFERYPDDWHRMSDAGLVALIQGPARRRDPAERRDPHSL